jgi:SAM-dependent methyltransferase
MSQIYASLTRADPNPIKRWFQRRRLEDAFRSIAGLDPQLIVDYGGGDGATSAMAIAQWPLCRVICFEPTSFFAEEASQLLAALPQAAVVTDEGEIGDGCADVVLCMEVLEHLPEAETQRVLQEIARILKPDGLIVVGVPVEVGLPALPKGIFRFSRRRGQFDANLGLIAAAVLGRPPVDRETLEIAPGRFYYAHHLGFDHRRLMTKIERWFDIMQIYGSPLPWVPPSLNSEIYVTARRRG